MSKRVPEGWSATSLGDFVEFQRGHDLPRPSRRPGHVPVVGSGGLTGWHDTAVVRGPGITIGRAANLGIPTLINEDFWPLNTTLYVTDFRGNDVRFVFYLLKVLDLSGFNSGSVQPMLNRNYIKSVRLVVPSRKEQEAISSLLGALDDKIAVNELIDKNCAELSSALFARHVWNYDLPLELPEGYKFGSIDDACESIGNGGTPKRMVEEYWRPGTIPWFKTGELSDGPLLRSEEWISEKGLAHSSCSVWPAGTVLVALYASPTVGRLGVLESDATFNQACSALVAKTGVGRYVLFETVKATRSRLQNIAVGAAQQNISQAVLRAHQVVIPSREAASHFHQAADALHRKRVAALRENIALVGLRDALLPKLISGQMRVMEAESAVSESV